MSDLNDTIRNIMMTRFPGRSTEWLCADPIMLAQLPPETHVPDSMLLMLKHEAKSGKDTSDETLSR